MDTDPGIAPSDLTPRTRPATCQPPLLDDHDACSIPLRDPEASLLEDVSNDHNRLQGAATPPPNTRLVLAPEDRPFLPAVGLPPPPLVPTVHHLFVNVKATFPDKQLTTIKAKLEACMLALTGMNVGFRLCCFDAQDNLAPITSTDQIGHHLTQLKRYFSGLSLNLTSWTQWKISWQVEVHLRYNENDFLSDANAVLEPLHIMLYRKRLQEPFTVTVGWLFKTSDRTNCDDLYSFLVPELQSLGFTQPFAVYHKVPFAGGASPDQSSLTPSLRSPAVHFDTIAGFQQLLYQRLKSLLKSPRMALYTNWKWKLFPVFKREMDQADQRELQKAMAKQKIVKKSVASCAINTIFDLECSLGPMSLRHFLLSQRVKGRHLILGLDRDAMHPSSFLASSSVTLRADLLQLVHFLPIRLAHQFGQMGQGSLSEEGLFLLEDQYWDSTTDSPRSRFSDDLREDHEDDGDIVIVLENFPGDLPAPDSGHPFPIDPDNLTQASFNTIGHSRPSPTSLFVSPPPAPTTAHGLVGDSPPAPHAPSSIPPATPALPAAPAEPLSAREASLMQELADLRSQLAAASTSSSPPASDRLVDSRARSDAAFAHPNGHP